VYSRRGEKINKILIIKIKTEGSVQIQNTKEAWSVVSIFVELCGDQCVVEERGQRTRK